MGQIQRLSRGRVKPYNSVPRIDWSHPLAAGLATYCYDIGGQIVDLVNGGMSTQVGASGAQLSQFGIGLKIPLTGYVYMPALPASKINPLGGAVPYSVAMGTLFVGTVIDGATVSIQDSANTENTVFGFNSASPNIIQGVYGNTNVQNYTQVLVPGTFQSWGMTAVTSNANQYVNGVLDSTFSGGTTFSGVTAPQIMYNTASINAGQTYGNADNGFVFYFSTWSRTLSVADFLTLHEDPYCFLIYPEDEMFATLVGATAGAAPNFGWWNRSSDDSRLLPVSRISDQGSPFFIKSSNPVPTIWLPRTGENRERDPPPVRRPDDAYPWSVRSPNPVPTTWLPTAGETEHPFPVKRWPDEPPGPFFVRSPNPVPTIAVPRTGEDLERLPPIKENPDPAKQWFVKSPNPVPTTWLPLTGEDRERLPPICRPPDEPKLWFYPSQIPVPGILWFSTFDQPLVRVPSDQYVVTWPARQPTAANTISGMAWWRPAVDVRLPISRPPDEALPWFVQSPNPVPTTWLPKTGEDVERLPPIGTISDRYVYTWQANIPPPTVPISGMAWNISKEEMRPPKPPLNPDEARQWFVRSPNQVPATWLPTAGETEHPLPVKRAPDEPPGPWFRPSQVLVPTTWLPLTGKDIDRLPAIKRSPDESFPFFTRSPSPVPTTWLPTTGETEHPVPVKRFPDEPPGPFFRPSPNPVPQVWLPKTGGDIERPPPVPLDWYVVTWPARTPIVSTIAGMAWWRPADDARPPVPPSDRYAVTWPPNIPPVVINTISGMAWWRPADDFRPAAIGILALDGVAWLPPFIPSPIPPVVIPTGGGGHKKPTKAKSKSGRIYRWGDLTPIEMTLIMTALAEDD